MQTHWAACKADHTPDTSLDFQRCGSCGKVIRDGGRSHDDWYTPARAFSAEGARVAIVTCRTCGAAILIDPGDNEPAVDIHTRWHKEHPETR